MTGERDGEYHDGESYPLIVRVSKSQLLAALTGARLCRSELYSIVVERLPSGELQTNCFCRRAGQILPALKDPSSINQDAVSAGIASVKLI